MRAMKLPLGEEAWRVQAASVGPKKIATLNSAQSLSMLHERLPKQTVEETLAPRRRWGVGRGWSMLLVALACWLPIIGAIWLLRHWLS